jgi:hypothetical protein
MRNDISRDASASRLQNGRPVMNLKRWIVGLLAAGALSGCGVGLDDPEGQAAAGKQGVVQSKGNGPTSPQSTSKTGAETSTSGTVNMGDPYLPQDPVPLYVIHQQNGDPQNPGGGCTTCQ